MVTVLEYSAEPTRGKSTEKPWRLSIRIGQEKPWKYHESIELAHGPEKTRKKHGDAG